MMVTLDFLSQLNSLLSFKFIFIGIVLLVLIISIFFAFYLEKKRRESLKAFALMHGYMFEAKPLLDEKMAKFKLGKHGYSRRMRNLISGSKRGVRIEIFDYQYRVGGGKSSSTYNQTVIKVATPSEIPSFVLSQENFFNKMAEKLGFQDIDFEEDKEFSDAFLLKGKDEVQIRQFFNKSLRNVLVSEAPITMESNGEEILIYTLRKRLKAAELDPLIACAMRIKDALPQIK